MGDMYYYGGENHHRHLEESVKMYTQAAALGDAQVIHSLLYISQIYIESILTIKQGETVD